MEWKMLGYDFSLFWNIGRAVLAGIDPYSVQKSFYPPATLALFTLFGLAPFTIAYALWTGINVILLNKFLRTLTAEKTRFLWFIFPSALFVLMAGQLDIFFLYATTLLPKKGLRAALGIVLLTLKPHIALIVLPWYLIQWIQHDRKTLIRAVLLTAFVHALPIVISPTIYSNWFTSMGTQTNWRLTKSSGIFVLTELGVPWALIAPIAAVIMLWCLRKAFRTSLAAQFFALPMVLWYDGVILIGTVPLAVLLPAGWVAFITAALLKSSWPLALTSLAALVWRLRKEYSGTPQPAPA